VARGVCREKREGQRGRLHTEALFKFLMNKGHSAVDEFLGRAAFRRRVFKESPGRYAPGSSLDETVLAQRGTE